MISKDKRAYVYLPESVDEFPAPETFMDIMRSVGFTDVKRRSQSFGIAQIYIGTK
jgi:demethylmenaquinone methyltransferase/2-methoxy-6-polyprenyl-1,4-benzoquinol methylase